jgi:IS30 family transposase
MTMLDKRPAEVTARAQAGYWGGVIAAFAELPASLRGTLTWDQGKQMAMHSQMAAATGMRVFFCEAHSPCQRGTNEDTNGLLRQYFPRGTDLSQYTPDDLNHVELNHVEAELNARPRKILAWVTPERLLAALPSTSSTDERYDEP